MLANLVLRWEEHGTAGGRVEVLDRAGLVISRRMGREVRYSARPERLGETARWMSSLAEEWGGMRGWLR